MPLNPKTMPTAKQAAALIAINAFQARHAGKSPSLRELGLALGIPRPTAQGLIRRMAEKGLVKASQVVVVQKLGITPAGKKWLEAFTKPKAKTK